MGLRSRGCVVFLRSLALVDGRAVEARERVRRPAWGFAPDERRDPILKVTRNAVVDRIVRPVNRPPRAIVLLGAQRFDPTLGEAVRELGIEGPIATITAGWQEREGEDQELHEHLGRRTINLCLYERAEDVFQRDPELHQAHRNKQENLRHRQDIYRIRLEHELEANHVIRHRKTPPEILADEQAASIGAIRLLDEYHLHRCTREHRQFDETYRTREREAVKRHRRELAAILKGASALAIAGGHVATLLNRLRLFGIDEMIDGHVVFAWTAGAMAISERVVLFHDSPPQGPGAAEVLDRGLGLCPGVVVFPHPETRLRLDDEERVSVLARRFAPALCLAMPARSRVTFREGRWENAFSVIRLHEDGRCAPLSP
jgi:hypothetical protein